MRIPMRVLASIPRVRGAFPVALALALSGLGACTVTSDDDNNPSLDAGGAGDHAAAQADAAGPDVKTVVSEAGQEGLDATGVGADTGRADATGSGLDSTAPTSDAGAAGDALPDGFALDVEAGVAALGPYVWKNAQIVGGGYMPSVVFNPKEKDLIYARTDMGGAYRWDPVNSVWIPLLDWVSMDDWNMWGMESIATDPVDPNNFYVAAGMYTNSWTTMNGVMLRSSDRGATFQQTPLPFKFGGNMTGRGMGERLAVDPNNNSVIYFGARSGNGLWRSLDKGVTWNQVSSFTHPGNFAADPTAPADVIGVVWIAFDPTSSKAGTACQSIYVGVADTTAAIYQSKDGGNTWSAVPGQPTAGYLPHHGVLASNGILYITYSDTAGPFDGGHGDVWKYDTTAAVWTLISPVPSTDTKDDLVRLWWSRGRRTESQYSRSRRGRHVVA